MHIAERKAFSESWDVISSGGDTLKEGFVLFVDEGEASKKILEELKSDGRWTENLKIIDISKSKLRGWLLLEYGSVKTPMLVTGSNVISGYEEVLSFLRKLVEK